MRTRRTLLASLLAAGVLASPASALVPVEWSPSVVTATAVGPRPVALQATGPAPAPSTPEQREALRRRVETALGGSTASTVASAVDVEGYGAVVRLAADAPLPPASTQKSFVGLTALVALGPNARYRTEVATTGIPVLGRLRGHVWLVAGGDPYLSKAYLRDLARQVRRSGITSISGEVRLDDLRYDQRRRADGWKPSFVPGQTGPLSALAVDGNRWRTDAAYLADPALPATALFRDYLREEGVSVGNAVRRERRPAQARTLAVNHGTTLATAVQRVLKRSDNFAAELLLKELGHVVRGDGSSAGGLAAVRGVLGEHGVAVGDGADGSGLSSLDRQSPHAQVRLLHAADGSGSGPAFRASLPLGCRDGTLRRRFCGTPAEGRVSAKTGTLSGVRALAGYTRTASGRQVRFAFQLRGVQDGARALAAIDRAVVALSSSTD